VKGEVVAPTEPPTRDSFAVPSSIDRIAVIGAGTMGAQIASLIACSGQTVRLYDSIPDALARGRERAVDQIIPAILSSGMLGSPSAEPMDQLRTTESLEEAVTGVELVIEAVREDVAVKRGVFEQLSALAPTAMLATNSSSLPSSLLVDAVDRPERLLNMHFFAPVWVRSMLEVMTCGRTNSDVLEAARHFGRSLGLVTAVVQGESKGFIINRIWRAVKRESLRVVDEGVATPEDIDRLWMMFFQTQYAPFGIMDMVGLDVVADIEATYHAVATDPMDRPSATLRRMIDEGKLGEKSGEGFYRHPAPAYLREGFLLADDDDQP
jgi:3-hydroxybutyryl-CoA dehydrogenase